MKKIIIIGLILSFAISNTSQAQVIPQGMNYQAIAYNMEGDPLLTQPVDLRISLISKTSDKVYYQESHQVITSELGLFNLVIGKGITRGQQMIDVPWSNNDIWLSVEMRTNPIKDYTLISKSQMLAVPYAMNAATADELVGAENNASALRNQSINWVTSGNNSSRPDKHFTGTRDATDFVVKTFDEERARYTEEGQLRIKSGVTGPDDEKSSYPLTVEGSDQGVYIKVSGSRTGANNFLTFADDSAIWGRVEGQTWEEKMNTQAFQIQEALFVLQGVEWLASAIGEGIEGAGLFASIFGAAGGAGSIVEGVGQGIAAAALLLEAISWRLLQEEWTGVYYSSGGADYAEYLEKLPGVRDLRPGEVVGVTAGKVSLSTENVDHYMVVSSAPVLLGNMPQSQNSELLEKIAFMGQVRVKVAGSVSIGDYIIPSGNNDGLGIAIHPNDMLLGDYPKIIGVAWEDREDAIFSYVNTAIGINTNDLSQQAFILNARVDNITGFLDGENALITDPTYFKELDPKNPPVTQLRKLISDEKFNQFLENNGEYLTDLYGNVKKQLEEQGVDFSKNKQLGAFLDNPLPIMKEVRKDPKYLTQWALIDQKLIGKED